MPEENVLVVPKETVRNEWYLPYDDNPELGIKIIDDNIIDNSRWSIYHELIVEINGKVYITSYSRGATEHQEEAPWEYEDNVEFYPAKKILIEKWVHDDGKD